MSHYESPLAVSIQVLVTRDETIWVNAVLRIVFECIAIYCHIAIFDWILVKRHFIWNMGFGSKEKYTPCSYS